MDVENINGIEYVIMSDESVEYTENDNLDYEEIERYKRMSQEERDALIMEKEKEILLELKAFAMPSIEHMSKLLLKKCLAERVISGSTRDLILDSFDEMSWPEKKWRSEAITSILESSKTEEEILEKVSLLQDKKY